MNYLEQKLVLSSDVEQNDREIDRAIHRASVDIHRLTLCGGAQFIICEGPIAVEWAKRRALERTYVSRYEVVRIERGIYKNCITLVKRGEYMRFEYPLPASPMDIPEVLKVPTDERAKDDIRVIYLEYDDANKTQ